MSSVRPLFYSIVFLFHSDIALFSFLVLPSSIFDLYFTCGVLVASSLRQFNCFIPIPVLSDDTRFPGSLSAAGRIFRWRLFGFWAAIAPLAGPHSRWFPFRARSVLGATASRPPAGCGRKNRSWPWHPRGSACSDRRASPAYRSQWRWRSCSTQISVSVCRIAFASDLRSSPGSGQSRAPASPSPTRHQKATPGPTAPRACPRSHI